MPEEERRAQQQEILDIIRIVQDQTNGGLRSQFKELKTSIESKLDKLTDTIMSRPCVAHSKDLEVLMGDRNFKRSAAITLIVILVAGLVGYGLLQGQVYANSSLLEKNTERLERLIDRTNK